MFQIDLVARTKLLPPRLHKHVLLRPRITQQLQEARQRRLLILQAGTGYGKTTALASLTEIDYLSTWYHLLNEDSDPLVFLLHLYHSLKMTLADLSDIPLALLEQYDRQPQMQVWLQVVDRLHNELASLLTEPLFVILDDVHLINHAEETLQLLDRFISRSPTHIHTILSTRYPLELPSLTTWRVHGQVAEINQTVLAFTKEEIDTLFYEQYQFRLTAEQLTLLQQRVEGWPMALPLIWQRWQGNQTTTLPQALGEVSRSTSELFTYLAQEVLAQQPDDVQAFLQETAVLRQMTAALCDKLRQKDDSQQILHYLREQDLFLVDVGDGYSRYHHLFHELLYYQLDAATAQAAHLRAATILQAQGESEEAIYHLLAAKAYTATAVSLVAMGRDLIRAGRLDTLAGWIGSLPPQTLTEHSPLLSYLGDIARLRSRFDEALGWYQQAETASRARSDKSAIGQALRGQARIYLDTVNPVEAEKLLQEALRLADGQDDRETQARLLDLLAENMLNLGRFKESEQYQQEAQQLRREGPGQAELPVRLLLRTGQLDKARHILEAQAEAERQEPVLRPRAHRETLLLLSLILAFQGEQEAAQQTALEGTERGHALESPFVTAVGHMRQGHAWLLQKNKDGYEKARVCFQKTIELSDTLDVPRLKVEAYWGLCQAYGFQGDVNRAELAADQGIAIAREAGDAWIEAGLKLVLGATLVLDGRYPDAVPLLDQAGVSFRDCGDSYGETIVRLWQSLLWHKLGDNTRRQRDVDALLTLAQTYHYDYIFYRPTLLGPPDIRPIIPLLLYGREQTDHAAYIDQLLRQLDLSPRLQHHPGYQLRVQTLGSFVVWQGTQAIDRKAWRRKKSLQLFLFLLTQQGKLLEREQITEALWPELPPAKAQRDFKIAYTSLCDTLEPDRERHAPSAYIVRDGSLYGLRPEADLWLDVAEFSQLIAQGDQEFEQNVTAALPYYEAALALYQGQYLREHPYEEWSLEARERWHTLYLRTADRMARTLVAQRDWEQAIIICQQILRHDDCWEQAYRLLMQAYEALGNRTQAIRTYHKCVERLEAELGVKPSPAMEAVWQQIRENRMV